MDDPIGLEQAHGAHNYRPLPVVLTHGEGAWVTDTAGVRYLDCLAAYSALNFGHRHPALVDALTRDHDPARPAARRHRARDRLAGRAPARRAEPDAGLNNDHAAGP